MKGNGIEEMEGKNKERKQKKRGEGQEIEN